MGLDMYLNRRTYIWTEKAEKMTATNLPDHIKVERIKGIEERLAYWRKANAIHNWFVNNLADGQDECQEIEVTTDDLKDLLDTVNKVLEASELVDGKVINGQRATENGWVDIEEDGKYIKDPTVAKELLPTSEGFFFGSTNYDQWYYDDLVDTKKILTEILEEIENATSRDTGDMYYQASW